MWYAPETWLASFLLATTVTGEEDLKATGEDCKEEAGLRISMIFTNPVFYPHYGVWTLMALLFGWKEVVDSPLYNV